MLVSSVTSGKKRWAEIVKATELARGWSSHSGLNPSYRNHPIHVEAGKEKGLYQAWPNKNPQQTGGRGIDIQKSVLVALDKVLEVGVPNIKLLWGRWFRFDELLFEDGDWSSLPKLQTLA